MKIIFAGGRDVEYALAASLVIDAARKSGWLDLCSEIVHGGANGIDKASESLKFLSDRHRNFTVFPADWKTHGKAAGPIRNKQMAEYADALIAIWDGKSRGTKNMIETMQKFGKPVYVHRYDQ